jgi:hypothetical protein
MTSDTGSVWPFPDIAAYRFQGGCVNGAQDCSPFADMHVIHD